MVINGPEKISGVIATLPPKGSDAKHAAVSAKGTVAVLPPSLCPTAEKVKQASTLKQALFDKVDTKGYVLEDYVMISGNLLDTGYLLLEAAMVAIPAINTLATSIISSTCGVVGGAINIGVGIICLKEAHQASINGDTKLANRLYISGLLIILIGIVMIVASSASLAAKAGSASGLAAFFAANPWILPVLFLAATIPTLIEVCMRTGKIWGGKDVGSQLQLKIITKMLDDEAKKEHKSTIAVASKILNLPKFQSVFKKADYETKNKAYYETTAAKKEEFEVLKALCKEKLTQNIAKEAKKIKLLRKKSENQKLLGLLDKQYHTYSEENAEEMKRVIAILFYGEKIDLKESTQVHKLSKKMEYLQAEIGVIAALQVFNLMATLIEAQEDPKTELTVEQIAEKVKATQKEINSWNTTQHIRLVQQLLYVAAFPISFMALAPGAKILGAVKDGVLGVASAIPIYLDAFKRFARNAPIVIKRISLLNRDVTMGKV